MKIANLEEKIKKGFKKELNEDVIKIKDSSFGIQQLVTFVETNKSKYILKIPKQKAKNEVAKQVFAFKKLGKRIPMPKVIVNGPKYLVEAYIEGESLKEKC